MTSSTIALLTADEGTPPYPPIPTRDQLCTARFNLQGLTVQTQQYGTLPWFEPALGWLSGPTASQDRQAAYAVKRADGNQVVGLSLSGQYAAPGQAYHQVTGKDFTKDWPALRALIRECLREGFYVRLFMAGDGQGAGPGYNDANGWTYGHEWLMSNLSRIVQELEDLPPYIQFFPGWDGIINYNEATQEFEPWRLEQLNAYLVKLRQLLPTCVSGVEPSIGPLGGTLCNFLSPAARDAIDLIANEFPGGSEPSGSLVWQVADRALGPAFVRPPNMPSDEDPWAPDEAHWSLRVPTSRGPIYAEAMEYDTYDWVRWNVAAMQVQAHREYYRRMGYRLVG